MALIIDCYNVLHCTHVLPDRLMLVGVTGLCRLLERSRWRGGPMTVVCDGTSPPTGIAATGGTVELVYAGPGRDADTLIEQRIAADTAPRRLIVVSNDRRIQRAARRRRARVLRSETFLHQLVHSADQPGPAEDKTPPTLGTDDWLRLFGFEPEPAEPRPRARPPRRPGKESETDRWLREFGFDSDDEA